MKSRDIRQLFLSYFEEHDHKIVPSSPLVPNDPTLLFTNAGMVPFKHVFLGNEKRPYTRAVSSQRCVRAGGKHNDLENVGYTARHHTFFEMLGNFSFGDYFKHEAIQFAWEFLTKTLGLSEEKLWVTVYKDDKEAESIWLDEMKVSPERFSRCGDKDNFWSMGDTGPCGPCTEIFYDHGEDVPGGPPGSPDEDGDRYVEIWNLVFMQYDRDASGQLNPLPKPSVDTGMGLERISAVMQGVKNNYDIDMFAHLIDAIFAMTNGQDRQSASLKVVADHIRSCAFIIIDGVLPGNEGRGYVLRRIIRRAVRHGHKLGIEEAFFYKLVAPLCREMGEAYPELVEMQAHIEKVLLQEEEQFNQTLSNGLKLLDKAIQDTVDNIIPGDVAFKLYDTYGFPLDLTADVAREHGYKVDETGFDALMDAQREKSKKAGQFSVDLKESLNLETKTVFCGYEHTEGESTITALLNDSGEAVDSLSGSGAIVLQETPFYAEAGGQVGDNGDIAAVTGKFIVTDTQKKGQAVVHYGKIADGSLSLNDKVSAKVNKNRREAIKLNHSATHLLHAALRRVLGNHVQQKGSLVDDKRARFDFSHYQALTADEISSIESMVNQQVRANHLVVTEEMEIEDAKASGAMALFGEQYSERVRVLSMGEFSIELCGGTHVTRTGDIGFCKIIQETGIASGIRRIEMLTGEASERYVAHEEALLKQVSQLFHTSPQELLKKADSTLKELKQLEKERLALSAKMASAQGQSLLDDVEMIGEYSVLVKRLDNLPAKDLRTTMDKVKDKMTRGIIVLVAVNDNKMNVVSGLTKDVVGMAPSAKALVQTICGKGGGRDDMAQGGGLLVADLDDRFKVVKKQIQDYKG